MRFIDGSNIFIIMLYWFTYTFYYVFRKYDNTVIITTTLVFIRGDDYYPEYFREYFHRRWFLTLNTLKPRQIVRHFPDDIFKCLFMNENDRISDTIWLKFPPMGVIDNNTTLVQIMAFHLFGAKSLSEPMIGCAGDACVRHSASMTGVVKWLLVEQHLIDI